MDDKIIGVHHSCLKCGYAYIEQAEDGLFSTETKSCPKDGYIMVRQDIWNNSIVTNPERVK